MLRTVLDANVNLSALLRGGVPGQILTAGLDGRFISVTSETLLDEVSKKLTGRFKQTAAQADESVSVLVTISEVVTIVERVHVCRDPKDDHVLACALAGAADVIVTGEKDLLVLHPFRGIRILTPRQFLDELTTAAPSSDLP